MIGPSPGRTIGSWAAALVAVWMLAIVAGGESRDGLSVPGSDSDAATSSLAMSSIGDTIGPQAIAVFVGRDGPIGEVAATAIDQALIDLSTEVDVADPDRPFVDGQVSSDGRTAFAEVRYSLDAEIDQSTYRRLLRLDDELDPMGVDVEIAGSVPDIVADPAPAALEYVGILVALGVLWWALRSFRLALWPVLSAAVAVGVAMGLVQLASAGWDVSSSAIQLAAMVGLGVGIDAGLLLVSRWSGEAVVRDSPAVLAVTVAVGTVVVSILGLMVVGLPFFTTTALATALSVLLVLCAARTLLPALLAVGGGGATTGSWVARPSPRHARFLDRVRRRPLAALLGGLTLVVVLAAPVPWLRLGPLDAAAAPVGSPRRVAHDQLTDGFGPGSAAPLIVTMDLSESLPWERGAIEAQLREALVETEGVSRALATSWGREGGEAAIRVISTVGPADASSRDVVDRVRAAANVAVAGTGAVVHVGGETATRIDVARRVESRLSWMVAVVIGLSVALLIAAWRAPLLAVKAAIVNLCSVAAAYGVLVAVFQWGWGASIIGLDGTVPIEPIVPVFMFAILFGLSMDYEVFLISAVRERFGADTDDREAVVEGLTATRRIVMVAALVMAAVFAGLVTGNDPVTKMFGVGLLAAVVVDATIGRGLLVPAALLLLGPANRWVPRWLAPRVASVASTEGGADGRGLQHVSSGAVDHDRGADGQGVR